MKMSQLMILLSMCLTYLGVCFHCVFFLQAMSFLEPKTVHMFYFTGQKQTTPSCPVQLAPDFNPSSASQSYDNSAAGPTCAQNCRYIFCMKNRIKGIVKIVVILTILLTRVKCVAKPIFRAVIRKYVRHLDIIFSHSPLNISLVQE